MWVFISFADVFQAKDNHAWMANGLGLALATYASVNISGAHLNPIITVSLAVFKKLSWTLVPIYLTAQLLGALLGIAIAYSIHVPGKMSTSHPNVEAASAWTVDVLVPAVIYVAVYFAVENNHQKPVYMGLTLTAVTLSNSFVTTSSINPAADVTARIAAAVIEGGNIPAQPVWFWCFPAILPFLGGLIGAVIATFLRLPKPRSSDDILREKLLTLNEMLKPQTDPI